jgi:hypothetical protein
MNRETNLSWFFSLFLSQMLLAGTAALVVLIKDKQIKTPAQNSDSAK